MSKVLIGNVRGPEGPPGLARVMFGTDVATPRPDAVVVLWIGDPDDRVIPAYVQDGDIVIYPTPAEVIPAWKLEDVPGVTIDFNAATLVGSLVDGATVSGHWTDSISGRTATAITSAAATLDVDGFNGHPCVTFPNDGALQATAYPNYTGPSTVFLLAQNTESASASDFFMDGVDGAAGVLKLAVGMQGGAWRAQRNTALAGSAADVAPHLIEVVFDGASSSIRVDNGPTVTGSTTAGEGFVNLIIGGRGGNTNRLTGQIARLIVVRGLVSVGDRNQIRAMLQAQGGLV